MKLWIGVKKLGWNEWGELKKIGWESDKGKVWDEIKVKWYGPSTIDNCKIYWMQLELDMKIFKKVSYLGWRGVLNN